VLEVLYYHAKFGVLGFHPPPGRRNTLSFLSVRHALLSVTLFLFVRLLNVRVCAPDFAMKVLKYRNDFMPLDRKRFVVAHRCSNFLDCRQLSTSLNAEIQKTAKIGGFRRQRAIE